MKLTVEPPKYEKRIIQKSHVLRYLGGAIGGAALCLLLAKSCLPATEPICRVAGVTIRVKPEDCAKLNQGFSEQSEIAKAARSEQSEMAKAAKMIGEAKGAIDKAETKIGEVKNKSYSKPKLAAAEGELGRAKTKLDGAEDDFNRRRYPPAFGSAVMARDGAKNAFDLANEADLIVPEPVVPPVPPPIVAKSFDEEARKCLNKIRLKLKDMGMRVVRIPWITDSSSMPLVDTNPENGGFLAAANYKLRTDADGNPLPNRDNPQYIYVGPTEKIDNGDVIACLNRRLPHIVNKAKPNSSDARLIEIK